MPYAAFADLNQFYERMGRGEPVLFLHSHYSRGLLAFASQILDFQSRYDCLFPDLRGHGRTQCPSLLWSTPQVAEDLVGLLDAVGVRKAHLVGYSFGGGVGLFFAARHPERVGSLTLIGQAGAPGPEGADDYEPDALVARGEQKFLASIEERHAEAHRGDWRTFLSQTVADWREQPALGDDDLRGLACPVLLIRGQHDPLVSDAAVEHFLRLVPSAEAVTIAGASHRPHMLRESPIEVNDLILGFLGRHSLHTVSAQL